MSEDREEERKGAFEELLIQESRTSSSSSLTFQSLGKDPQEAQVRKKD